MRSIKRVFSYILLLLCCSVLMSCDIKRDTLDCTIDKSSKKGITEQMNTIVEYGNDKVETVSFIYSVDYDRLEYTEDDMKEFVDNIENGYKETYDGNKNIVISKERVKDTKYEIKVVIKYNKLSVDEREKYGLTFPDRIEKSRTDFTTEGYTCK